MINNVQVFVWLNTSLFSLWFHFFALARKRTGDAEIGWRPTPEKNIETMPCWGKIAQKIASWTWDVTNERAISPADLFGGKVPVGALICLLERIC